jgi:hypothetical protein
MVIDSPEELDGLHVRRTVQSLSPISREIDLQSGLDCLTEA